LQAGITTPYVGPAREGTPMPTIVSDLYSARVAAGLIRDDAAQRAVLPHLGLIRTWAATPPLPRTLSGFFRKAPEPPRGLYLWGGVGRGKSMVMDLFAGSLTAHIRRVHFHAFMLDVHARMNAARARGVDDALAPVGAGLAEGIRVLALDEMQITDITDAMIVGRLFQMLMDAGVVVVTTSNRPPDDLYKDGLNRALFLPFIALLKARMVVHHLASPTDYRQDRIRGQRVYFSPNDASAQASVQGLWHDLTKGTPVTPLTLRVQGRDVVLPESANGVARASFWDLCGRALGPADYLAIAGAIRVLVLTDIPRLSSENYNPARRFVTLIDALYEARVRLIASAADVPDRLYLEGEGSFEFARTASRLMEMQSDGWGA
jgi:cell division protein ZapE